MDENDDDVSVTITLARKPFPQSAYVADRVFQWVQSTASDRGLARRLVMVNIDCDPAMFNQGDGVGVDIAFGSEDTWEPIEVQDRWVELILAGLVYALIPMIGKGDDAREVTE